MVIPEKKRILVQLDKIICSEIFKNSKKLCDFLSLIVKESQKNDGMELKQYNITVFAFGRNPDFDPIDPIVRIQAKRLRNNLNFYYQKEGINDQVIISLPKGSYVPQFSIQNLKDIFEVPPSNIKKNTLAIYPFKNLSKKSKKQYIVDGFSEELLMEVSRYKHIQLLRASPKDASNLSLTARFSLKGSIRYTGKHVKIFISVIDNLNHHQIWSNEQKLVKKEIDWIKIQEDIAIKVGQQITDITGILHESLSGSSNWQNTDSSQAYDAMLLLHQYNNGFDEGDIELVINNLENTLKEEPEIGYIWAVLAGIYTDFYIFGEDKMYLDKALKYAEKAITLQPNNQVCHTYYAYPLFVSDDVKATTYHLNKALELNPNSPYFMSSIGWCFALNGEWEKGLELVEKSIELDYKYPKWLHLAPFLHFLLKEDYVNAHKEAYKLDFPGIFWDPLVKLVACHKLDRLDEAFVHLSNLLLFKPNFMEVSEKLVGHLVKPKSLKEDIQNSIKEVFAFKPAKK